MPKRKTVVYKRVGNVELELHVCTPHDHKASEKRPAIVFFFGGGWNRGTASQFFSHCEYLVSRGTAVLSAEYRVKSRNNNTPPTVVFLGTRDHLVPVKTAEEYKRLMETNGLNLGL